MAEAATAGTVEVVRWAKQRGWLVTCEATPHHLLLTDDHAAFTLVAGAVTHDPGYLLHTHPEKETYL